MPYPLEEYSLTFIRVSPLLHILYLFSNHFQYLENRDRVKNSLPPCLLPLLTSFSSSCIRLYAFSTLQLTVEGFLTMFSQLLTVSCVGEAVGVIHFSLITFLSLQKNHLMININSTLENDLIPTKQCFR